MIPDRLHQAILNAPQQQLTFAQFMELVLYDPVIGYYHRQSSPIGFTGDFVTSPYLSPDFSQLIAVQVRQMWIKLGQPEQFCLVEMGAGPGRLAADFLDYAQQQLPDFFQALHYQIIERSQTFRQQQEAVLGAWHASGKVSWHDWDSLEPGIIGCFLSNELVDAFPVHRVCWVDGTLQEVYVGLDATQTQLTERLGQLSSSRLADYFALIEIDLNSQAYPNGYTTEVNLAALDWLTQIASYLQQGFILTIDYGYPAATYYHPSRSDGTLQAYVQHQHHNNPYLYLGEQDLTAHVDFTALQHWGQRHGLATLRFTHQAPWLMSLGLGERLAQNNLTGTNLQQTLQRREVLHQLINPLGLGGLRVLCQSKNVNAAQGLFQDFAPMTER